MVVILILLQKDTPNLTHKVAGTTGASKIYPVKSNGADNRIAQLMLVEIHYDVFKAKVHRLTFQIKHSQTLGVILPHIHSAPTLLDACSRQ